MNPDLEQLVETDDLDPDEEARLRHVHELLLKAGPPPELPTTLARLPQAPSENQNVLPFPSKHRRRSVVLLLAATVAAACFGSGYLVANQTQRDAIHIVRVVSLQGTGPQASLASLRIGTADSNGNRPVELTVSGLRPLGNEYARYFLMLWKNGKPTLLCGIFKVGTNSPTTVRFSVPYPILKSTRWVVTEMGRGTPFPGHVVMTTA
jgi:hypothetical protein